MQQFRGFQRFIASAAILAMLLLAACAKDDPEQAVRRQVEAMQAAIDARDAGDVEDLLAQDFVGNDGMDRRAIRQLAAGIFLRHREVTANVGPVSVELRGETDAIARFSVLATGGSGGFLPDSGQVYQVETGWRLVDGEWKLLNASWTPNL
ncbi:MAG TPA: nuclear transport factor 2 family protein [Thermomonas sp.]|nr:nuclear transport factor 2 family protein [Thermomonas sp.]